MGPNVQGFVVPVEEGVCGLPETEADSIAMGNVRVVLEVIGQVHEVVQVVVLGAADSSDFGLEHLSGLVELSDQGFDSRVHHTDRLDGGLSYAEFRVSELPRLAPNMPRSCFRRK